MPLAPVLNQGATRWYFLRVLKTVIVQPLYQVLNAVQRVTNATYAIASFYGTPVPIGRRTNGQYNIERLTDEDYSIRIPRT